MTADEAMMDDDADDGVSEAPAALPPGKIAARLTRDALTVRWHPVLEDFFRTQKIYLRYPWKVANIFREGERVVIPTSVVAEPYTNMPPRRFMSAGAFSYCRSNQVPADFRLGRYCSVAPHVRLSDEEHPLDRVSTHVFTFRQHMADLAQREFSRDLRLIPTTTLAEPPDIGHDVWLGRAVIVKRRLRIGHGAVVAERSIVTKDVPPFAIVAGAPARIVRYRFDDRTIEALLALGWWQYNFADFADLDFADVPRFIGTLSERIAAGLIQPYQPATVPVARALYQYIQERSA